MSFFLTDEDFYGGEKAKGGPTSWSPLRNPPPPRPVDERGRCSTREFYAGGVTGGGAAGGGVSDLGSSPNSSILDLFLGS